MHLNACNKSSIFYIVIIIAKVLDIAKQNRYQSKENDMLYYPTVDFFQFLSFSKVVPEKC